MRQKTVIAAYLWSSLCSIALFVFVNSATPFLLALASDTESKNAGKITGSLILADETLALFLVLIWGRLIDLKSLRLVATAAHAIAALSLLAMCHIHTYPQLLFARLFFSFGHSGLTVLLSASLALLTDTKSFSASREEETSEEQPLILKAQADKRSGSTAKLAGAVGFASGLGALLAVFVFLRLPPVLAPDQSKSGLNEGLQRTFYLVAALEVCTSVICWCLLTISAKRSSHKTKSIRQEVSLLLKGFHYVFRDGELALACASGMTARAATIIASTFLPLYITQFFNRTGRCNLDPGAPPTKQDCKEAFILSSSLSGVVQLVSWLAAIIVGYIGSRRSSQSWQPKILSVSYFIGAIGLLLFAFLPHSDPTNYALTIPSTVLIGYAQMAGVALSLSICARSRARLVAELPESSSDISGAISGAYSFFGGLAILTIAQIAGFLGDKSPGAPFLLMGLLYILLSANSAIFVFKAAKADSDMGN